MSLEDVLERERERTGLPFPHVLYECRPEVDEDGEFYDWYHTRVFHMFRVEYSTGIKYICDMEHCERQEFLAQYRYAHGGVMYE